MGDPTSLISAKEETIRLLTEQLEAERAASAELRRIVADLVQRVPEVEPAKDLSEPPEAPVSASEGTDKGSYAPRAAGALRAPLVVASVLRVGVMSVEA